MEFLAVTDSIFQTEVIDSPIPVLVDFWAVWCGSCHALIPMLHELAEEYDGKVKITKLDVDNNHETATKYNVRSMPTILIFNNCVVVDQIVGLAKKSVLTAKLDNLVDNNQGS
jgi:thioredoxin 1